MPRKSKEQRLAEVHEIALQQFEDSHNATADVRERALMCRRFVNVPGAQWDWDEDGDFSGRMKFEIDQISLAVERIRNERRGNQITAAFVPSDGSEADALADACASRFRADTLNPRGKLARNMAFDSAVEGGFGGLRLRGEVEKGDYQRICLEPVHDAESCLFFDVNAKEQDKSDAGHAFLITPWTRRAYEAEYGADAASWPDHLRGRFGYDWFGVDTVRVAEYFLKEDKTETYRVFSGYGDEIVEYLDDEIDDQDLADLEAQGFVEQEPRVEKIKRVVKYVMNGAKILEGPEVIPGTEIPLIPEYGHYAIIDGKEHFWGRVQKSVDSQILHNIQVSKIGETAAASSVEKPIFTPEQIAGHEASWQEDHRQGNAFLLINALTDAQGNPMPSGPIAFTKSPSIPDSVATLVAVTKQSITDQMGSPENGEQLAPDSSGIALELVQGRIDMLSYIYMDNAAVAERRLAQVWLSMASEIYVEDGRALKTLGADGKAGQVTIGKKVLDPKTGKIAPEIDFARAEFDVDVDIGPTSASRRSAIVRTIAGLMQAGMSAADPETQIMLTHVALMNMEGEGLSGIRAHSRKKLVAMGVEKPTREEKAEMEAAQANQAPDPQAQLADALAAEAKGKAMRAAADAGLAVARTEQARAETAETLAGIPIAQQRSALETAQAIADATAPTEGMAQDAGQ